jgi:type IV secretion system protein VirB3
MNDNEDDLPTAEPVSLALTRPLMVLGVRYEIFWLNGLIGVSAYLCQRDIHIFHIFERLFLTKRAMGNTSFWGARSYSP